MSGKLEMIIGPMFSGKTTELINKIREFKENNKKLLILKSKIDDRYTLDKIVSHSFEMEDCVIIAKLEEIEDNIINQYEIVIIDEAQFIPDLKKMITRWVDNYPIHFIIAGLDGDYQRNPIGDILSLISHADIIHKYTSKCNLCKNDTSALFTFRMINLSDTILVGGRESYMPLCRDHYIDLSKPIPIFNQDLIYHL